jgi:hypothetical protein
MGCNQVLVKAFKCFASSLQYPVPPRLIVILWEPGCTTATNELRAMIIWYPPTRPWSKWEANASHKVGDQ